MSKADLDRIIQELKGTKSKDQPEGLDSLCQEEKDVLTYWIAHAIQPATKEHDVTSYGLKHHFERETNIYTTNAEFKSAMLLAGYLPIDARELNWTFKIKPTYNKKTFPRTASVQSHIHTLPTFRVSAIGEPDEQLNTLALRARAWLIDDYNKRHGGK